MYPEDFCKLARKMVNRRHPILSMNHMDTHQKYKTTFHWHFDFSYEKEDGASEYPCSGLMLVECEDGRYYLEQEFGNEYGAFPGVVESREDLTTEPTFYTSLEAAARAAFALIKQVYPSTPDIRPKEFLED